MCISVETASTRRDAKFEGGQFRRLYTNLLLPSPICLRDQNACHAVYVRHSCVNHAPASTFPPPPDAFSSPLSGCRWCHKRPQQTRQVPIHTM